MRTLRLIINIILGICGFAIFNESDTFAPNVFGLFCLALLVAINIDEDTLRKIQDR